MCVCVFCLLFDVFHIISYECFNILPLRTRLHCEPRLRLIQQTFYTLLEDFSRRLPYQIILYHAGGRHEGYVGDGVDVEEIYEVHGFGGVALDEDKVDLVFVSFADSPYLGKKGKRTVEGWGRCYR